MNIFILDSDPEKAARDQCDKHVVKMILESAQLMATAMTYHGVLQAPYKPTHVNHPCSIWARATRTNYLWLLSHHEAMLDEYTLRYGKEHKTSLHFNAWEAGALFIPEGPLTDFAQAMPVELKIPDDPVQAYRNFYHRDKSYFASWSNGRIPAWWHLDMSGV